MLFADVEETLYCDAYHFGPAGHERFAEVIAEALLEALPDDPLGVGWAGMAESTTLGG